MRTIVSRLVPVVVMAFAPMAAVPIATPAVSLADCANGEWWDPKANVCRATDAQIALPCDAGQWWDPTATGCRPLVAWPQSLACVGEQLSDQATSVYLPIGSGGAQV